MKPYLLACLAAVSLSAAPAHTAPQVAYGPELQGFDYPHPVERFTFRSQDQSLAMAFMDVAPVGRANGRTVVLLHGKNFCAATWAATVAVLTQAGYRVIAPDQIGFCKSSKPQRYQYSFEQLARNTHDLLRARGVTRAVLVGHSMGGMLAARYALTYPADLEQLVLVDPLGLEDWRAKGVPPASVDELYAAELKTTRASLKAYQLKFYYNGQWRPEYDRWIDMQWGMYAGPGKAQVAWSQALTSDMIYTQPVVHELRDIQVPTLLIVGGKDRTAPGGNRASPDVQARLGRYDQLGREVAQTIPHARLVEFPELGHAPQVEAPDRFHAALLSALANGSARP